MLLVIVLTQGLPPLPIGGAAMTYPISLGSPLLTVDAASPTEAEAEAAARELLDDLGRGG